VQRFPRRNQFEAAPIEVMSHSGHRSRRLSSKVCTRSLCTRSLSVFSRVVAQPAPNTVHEATRRPQLRYCRGSLSRESNSASRSLSPARFDHLPHCADIRGAAGGRHLVQPRPFVAEQFHGDALHAIRTALHDSTGIEWDYLYPGSAHAFNRFLRVRRHDHLAGLE
jgi:hypothetical protein